MTNETTELVMNLRVWVRVNTTLCVQAAFDPTLVGYGPPEMASDMEFHIEGYLRGLAHVVEVEVVDVDAERFLQQQLENERENERTWRAMGAPPSLAVRLPEDEKT